MERFSLKKFIWIIWGIATVCLAGYYAYQFQWADNKTPLLIGETTHGHHQIELACTSCHAEPFGGNDVLQDACVNCHGKELELADDSHPKSKFTDPRNADRVAILNAKECVTCHAEHNKENTLAMGLTIQQDYCFYCHEDIAEDRPSHKGMEFETCATSGCHNYHDNRALYEDFLIEHGKNPAILKEPIVPSLTSLGLRLEKELKNSLLPDEADAPVEKMDPIVLADWHESDHSKNSVNCSDCHSNKGSKNKNAEPSLENPSWIEKPTLTECQSCHSHEVDGFTSGKHGMRLSKNISGNFYGKNSPVTPRESSDLVFDPNSLDIEHGCSTCHSSHRFDTQVSAVESCLNCHADNHSLAFEASPHFALWDKELKGSGVSGSGVSCATCHLPRETHLANGKNVVRVQHNQNFNLRPNEKMIRSVCMNCHGLEFSIDALADSVLIENNFNGEPSVHIKSVDMALDRLKETAH